MPRAYDRMNDAAETRVARRAGSQLATSTEATRIAADPAKIARLKAPPVSTMP